MSQAGQVNSSFIVNPTIPTLFVTNVGDAVPSANTLQILGGTGITTSAVGNVITITNTGSSSSITFMTVGGNAASSGGAITFTGAGGLAFSGSGSTVTGTLSSIPNASLANSSVTVNTAGTLSGGGTVSLGGTITLTGTGGSGTVTSVSGTANQVAVATGTTTPVISLVGPYTPSTYTTHGVLIGEGTSSITALGAGTAGQVLQSGGASSDPAYSTTTYPATNAVNTLLYASSANVMSALATANTSYLTTSSGGVPTWAGNTVTQFNVLVGGASSAVASVAPSATSGIPLVSGGSSANPSFTTAVVGGGGTGNTTFTAYSIICAGTTATGIFQNVVGVGSAGNILRSAGASALPAWTTTTYPATNAINTLLYASAANVMSALATANNGVLITSSTGVPSILADGTTGQVLTATTGAHPAWANLGSEGTWTPTLTGGSTAGTTTYTDQFGTYVIIGNFIFLSGLIIITGATGTGNAVIGGFPNPVGSTNGDLAVCAINISAAGWTWPVGSTSLVGLINNGGLTMTINGIGSATATSPLQMANAAANIYFNVAYRLD